ncbi:hypothetical protein QJS10_CPB17g02429 [Acorus calamus]|uniref:CYTH domain-containing protein n=1 Tax=Acorus calamus TaxID=4465 RepID=A0AAV9CSG0_ACOCL|nr:hypothetical protein QJS10_CPB17g02429 [Acorus calamus]
MEVEVKLRLPDASAHSRLAAALSPHHLRTHHQHNFFFDGSSGELSSRRAVLRLRFYGPSDSRCVASLKARAVIADGISRVEEDEEDLDPLLARPCVADPGRLAMLVGGSRVLTRVKEEFGVGDGGLVCLGGFENVRGVYGWMGLTVELDETRYDFGTSYEVECETSEPERAREMLEGFLAEEGIPYAYSEASKFAVFRAGKLAVLRIWARQVMAQPGFQD